MKKMLGVLVIVVLGASFAMAQTFRGEISGTVIDSSGAAVSDAEVKATQTGTGLERKTVTDSSGEYKMPELPLGDYTVTITKTGFKTQTTKGVQVSVGNAPRVNSQLSPGEVSQSIEVTADVPLVETTSNIMGGTIPERELKELPINGRDYIKTLYMVPGAAGDPSGVTDSPGSFGLFSINGNRGRSNNYLLDGTDMNDGYRNLPAINEAGVFGTPATILPLDALAEIPVMNGVEAQYGRNSGAIVNIVTKSGTNNWHGSAFGYFRGDGLDARNFFNTTDQPQNEFSNRQFGGSLGGPVITDKTFFFFAYEGQRETGGLSSLATVPSAAQIAFYGGATNPVIASLLALDPWGPLPATGTDNCDIGAGEDPIAGTCSADLQQPIPFSNRVDSMIFKIDQHIGRHLLTGRISSVTATRSSPWRCRSAALPAPCPDITPSRPPRCTSCRSRTLTCSLRGCSWKCAAAGTASMKTSSPRTAASIPTPSAWRRSATRRISGCPRSASPASLRWGRTPRPRADASTRITSSSSTGDSAPASTTGSGDTSSAAPRWSSSLTPAIAA